MTYRREIPGIGLVAVLALFGQNALGDEVSPSRDPDVIRVTTQRPVDTLTDTRIEIDAQAIIDAIDRRFAEDLEKSLEALGVERIELAISEVPTRG